MIGFTTAIDWIKGLPGEALQWGADIIDAIVSGITGAVGKVRRFWRVRLLRLRLILGLLAGVCGRLSLNRNGEPICQRLQELIQLGLSRCDAIGQESANVRYIGNDSRYIGNGTSHIGNDVSSPATGREPGTQSKTLPLRYGR